MNEELVEQGVVIKSEEGIAEIELIANENCEECSAKLFCKPNEGSTKHIHLKDNYGYKKGDRVTISIPGKSLLLASCKLYLYPLILFVAFISLGLFIFTANKFIEVYSFLLATSGVAAYYIIFYLFNKNQKLNPPSVKLIKSDY
jgi:sigma-E factor negative regulatory protein RseC